MAFLTPEELAKMGFKRFGRFVQISDKASFYGTERIEIGDHVRIDDFSVLSAGAGGISFGSYIHIAIYASIIGAGRVTLGDYSCLSSRVSVYSSNDDYSGMAMTNSTVPDDYKNVRHAPVIIGKHAIVGSGSIVLPGVTLGEGVAIGALSLVTKDCDAFTLYAGTPAKKIKARKKDLLVLEGKITFSENH